MHVSQSPALLNDQLGDILSGFPIRAGIDDQRNYTFIGISICRCTLVSPCINDHWQIAQCRNDIANATGAPY